MPVGQGHHAPAAEDKGFKVHFYYYKQDGRRFLEEEKEERQLKFHHTSAFNAFQALTIIYNKYFT